MKMNKNLTAGCFVLALVIVLGAVAGCIRSPDKEYGGRGEFLTIGAHKPKILDRVVYTYQGQNYVVTSQQEGMVVAVVQTRAVNLKSTQVTLSIDELAVSLIAENGVEFRPFEPGMQAEATSEEAPKDNPYGTHIWGQIQLLKDFEIAGWFFFEVPEDVKFTDFVWEDVEYVRVRYPQ